MPPRPRKLIIKYTGLTALGFLLFWALLIVVEVKVRLYGLLPYLYLGSLPLVFAGLFLSGWLALGMESERRLQYSSLLALLLSPVLISLGVVAGVNFKFLLGGSL